MNWGKFITARYIVGGISNHLKDNNFQGTKLENKFGNISEEKSFGSGWGNSWKGFSWGIKETSKKLEWKGANWGGSENKENNSNWSGTNWGKAW